MAIPQFDVTVRGVALENFGLTETETVEGLGLLTQGLIWPCAAIWYGPIMSTGATTISTTWSALGATITTSWTNISPTLTTTWVDYSTNGIEDC
jgi:Flp pilus assembly pilin Flp